MDFSYELGFVDFAIVEDDLWFCNVFTGDIICLDLETDVFLCKGSTNVTREKRKMQYGLVELVNGKLYFLPRNATKIFVYNIEQKLGCTIELEKYSDTYEKPLFISMCRKDNMLFLVPGRYSCLVGVNTDTDTLEYYSLGVRKGKKEMFTNCNAVVNGNEIIVYKNNSNTLLSFDCVGKNQKSIPIESRGFRALSSLTFAREIVYAGFGSEILIYNKANQKIDIIDYYDECEKPVEGVGQLLCYGNLIFAIALNQPIIYEVSLENRNLKEWIKFDWGDKKNEAWDLFTKCDIIGARIIEDRMILYSTIRNSIIEIDAQTKEIRYHDKFFWQKENKKKFVNDYIKRNSLIREGDISLNDFLDGMIGL